jgi:uracil-DNA glycosylase family 4
MESRRSLEKSTEDLISHLEEKLKFFSQCGIDYIYRVPIEERILACQNCALAQTRTNAVPGEGNPNAKLMFVGEAPGRDEDVKGRPFVGRAGQLLTRIIHAMKFRRDDVFITNIIKCRPPNNRTPSGGEIEKCKAYLLEQIESIQPRVIVALGRVAANFFIPGGQSISAMRGNFHEYGQMKIMPTFHPSYLVRNEQNKHLKKLVWEDMKKVMAFLGRR